MCLMAGAGLDPAAPAMDKKKLLEACYSLFFLVLGLCWELRVAA